MRKHLLCVMCMALALAAVATRAQVAAPSAEVQFIFTSDAHYGITRPAFQGRANVDGHTVNHAMIARINALPGVTFPTDGGLRAGQPVGPIDFLAEGGDVANREEVGETSTIQSARVSWAQFTADYLDGLTVTDHAGRRAPVYIVPGNHDVTNTVGFYRPMTPPVDKTSMVEIYNRMMNPAIPKTAATLEYPRDRVLTSRDLGGIHFEFITMWPDSANREWLDNDLRKVSDRTPVFIFTHDEPEAEAKHFTNPNGAHDINPTDKFENLLVDQLADKLKGVGSTEAPTTIEQAALEAFFRKHPNITAYFHGNSNWNQFYDWTGPGHSVAVHMFRVDSPMKGHFSARDETKLSFQVVTIDTAARVMTVRECLWDADPAHPAAPVVWGASTTVALQPRP